MFLTRKDIHKINALGVSMVVFPIAILTIIIVYVEYF